MTTVPEVIHEVRGLAAADGSAVEAEAVDGVGVAGAFTIRLDSKLEGTASLSRSRDAGEGLRALTAPLVCSAPANANADADGAADAEELALAFEAFVLEVGVAHEDCERPRRNELIDTRAPRGESGEGTAGAGAAPNGPAPSARPPSAPGSDVERKSAPASLATRTPTGGDAAPEAKAAGRAGGAG